MKMTARGSDRLNRRKQCSVSVSVEEYLLEFSVINANDFLFTFPNPVIEGLLFVSYCVVAPTLAPGKVLPIPSQPLMSRNRNS